MKTDSSTSPSELASHPEGVSTPAVQPRTLRWWPAACLVVLMFLLRMIPALVESPSLPVIFASFLGPAVAGVLILLWWVTFSRSSIRERLLGALLTIAMIGIGRQAVFKEVETTTGLKYATEFSECLFNTRNGAKRERAQRAVARVVIERHGFAMQARVLDGNRGSSDSWDCDLARG